MTSVIETFDLTKIYRLKGKRKSVLALDKVNISIEEGETFGLLGPNGAGKTTMIQILTTLIQPTSGYALINGNNLIKHPKKAKNEISLMLDNQMLYNRITAYDNLKFFCKLYNVTDYKEKIFTISQEFGLEKWLNQYIETFSSGMRMKLALCRTLLLNRNILFLDEPTLGLDVKMKSFIVNKLKNLKSTVFLTSHDMDVVEKLCNRIAFINKGKIVKIGTKNDLKNLLQTEIPIEIEVLNEKSNLIRDFQNLDFIYNIKENNRGITLSLKMRHNFRDLFSILSKYNVQNIKVKDLSIEDLFLKLVT